MGVAKIAFVLMALCFHSQKISRTENRGFNTKMTERKKEKERNTISHIDVIYKVILRKKEVKEDKKKKKKMWSE